MNSCHNSSSNKRSWPARSSLLLVLTKTRKSTSGCIKLNIFCVHMRTLQRCFSQIKAPHWMHTITCRYWLISTSFVPDIRLIRWKFYRSCFLRFHFFFLISEIVCFTSAVCNHMMPQTRTRIYVFFLRSYCLAKTT